MLNGHKTNIHEVNVKEKKEKKIHKNLTTARIDTLLITKASYANSPHMYMTTLISKLLPLLSQLTKGKYIK